VEEDVENLFLRNLFLKKREQKDGENLFLRNLFLRKREQKDGENLFLRNLFLKKREQKEEKHALKEVGVAIVNQLINFYLFRRNLLIFS